MNETELGQLDVSRGPGVYALEVAIPDNGEQIARYWHRYHDHAPQKAFFARLAAAESCLYVGASGNVYGRLCDHVAGEVRKASFLEAFPPTGLHSVWEQSDADAAFSAEYNVARELATADTRVWTDGELL